MAAIEQPELGRVSQGPAIFALLFAAGVAASFCRLPSARFPSWNQLWAAALVRLVTVWISSAGAAWAFSALIPNLDRIDSRRLIRETSVNALWLAPLSLFIREKSLWTIVISATLAVLVTQSIRGFQPSPAQAVPEESLLFSLRPDRLPLSFKHAPKISTLAALCAQTGVLAAFAGYPFGGAFLVGVAFVAWTWCYTRQMPAQWQESASTEAHSLMVVTLTFLFVVGALLPYLQMSHEYGRFGISVGNHGWPAIGAGHHRRQPVHGTNPDPSAVTASAGDVGIILVPLPERVTKLVAPTPMRLATMPANGRASDLLIIPFNGVYWFFKAPDVQPPQTSRQAHASPETVEIRSVDRRPLSIEAHDYLGNLIDLSCCSRIQIAIRNADRYPETVSLELVLVNTSLPRRPSVSLGRALVKSTQPWDMYGKPSAASETLNFSIPQRSSLHRFDEVKIVFRLDRARADAGAKIAIDHFVLVPRGL